MGFNQNNSQSAPEPARHYSNFFKVGFNAYEFVFEFGQYFPEHGNKAEIFSRIVTGPTYAKAILNILAESIEHYEHGFGEIEELDE